MACESEQAIAIQRVVKAYQSNARDNLRGPSGYITSWLTESTVADLQSEELKRIRRQKTEAKMAEQPMPQRQHPPISTPSDTKYVYGETELEGHRIVCFTVGGEHRLCLPQVLQVIQTELKGSSMTQVQQICQELFINLSRCNEEQLELLKRNKELPEMAGGCGLITKTDAERLVNKLLHSHPIESHQPLTHNSFKVYHECFGKSKGVIIPELYVSASANCIKCSDCYGLFSTETFVGHTHKSLENRTMHWGFDPKNWRHYLHLAKDQDHKDRLQLFLEDLKCKFSRTYKRKECPAADQGPYPKRPRLHGDASTSSSSASDTPTTTLPGDAKFQPWTGRTSSGTKLLSTILSEGKAAAAASSVREENGEGLPHYLHKGPPKLLNPERVIPFDDQKQYARHFAPNISLVPVHPKKQKCKEYQEAMEAAAAAAAEEEKKRHHPRRESSSVSSSHPSVADSVADDSDSHSTQSANSPPLSSTDVSASHGQEVELFEQALATDPSDTAAADRLRHRFRRVCQYKAQSIAGLTSSANTMRTDITNKTQTVVEYEKQMEVLKAAADTNASRHRHQQHQLAEQYRQQLSAREAQYSDLHSEMLREVHRLREQLRGLGKQVPEIAYDLELIGDCPRIKTPPDSPKPDVMMKIKEEKE